MVPIVETGTSLGEIYSHSLVAVILLGFVNLRELIFVVPLLLGHVAGTCGGTPLKVLPGHSIFNSVWDQLVSIVVLLQLLLSTMME